MTSSSPRDATLNKYSLEYSYAELCEATANFDESHRLGTGSYGAVYRGIRRDGTDIAVKVLELPDEAGFEEEVRVLSKFRHPHLVILMGFARRDATRYLIYEMLAGGDVYQRLQKCSQQGSPFTWRERTSAAFDASCGLSHLHHATPKVFHRDIKTANILLDRNGTAKMADFGLACLSHAMAHKVEKTAGTTGYACPLYAKRSVVTEGSEVYSFGMVLLEMLTNTAPAILVQGADGNQYYRFLVCDIQGSADIAVSKADARAAWPPEAAKCLARLGLRCTEEAEEHRPNFADVVNCLRPLRDYSPPEVRISSFNSFSEAPSPKAATPKAVMAFMPRPEIAFLQRPVAQHVVQQAVAQQPVQHPVPQAVVAQPVQHQLPQQVVHHPMPQAAALVSQLPRQMPSQQPRKLVLWSLKCTFAEGESFTSLPQDRLAIIQWQDVGSPLSTTLHVGLLFQDEFFNSITSGSCAYVSREHFQIWAEQLHMPGILEPTSTCYPCSFFLTNYSANGTIVNGSHVGKAGTVQLHNGDTICIPRVMSGSEGTQLVQGIQFRFDISGSILQDMTLSSDGNLVLDGA